MTYKEIHVSWKEIENLSEEICDNIHKFKFDGIIAISRGGLIPAGIISKFLNIHLVTTLCIKSYSGQKQKEPKILKIPEVPNNGNNWLMIDDLVDTGITAKIVTNLFPKAYFVSLLYKCDKDKVSSFYTQFSAKYISPNVWITFPWE